MKYLLSFFVLVSIIKTDGSLIQKDDVYCLISSTKKVYKFGQTPEIEVSIVNDTQEDLVLIGSLDGSEETWRKPYCYFEIQKPFDFKIPSFSRCGNVNPLRIEDFVKVKKGEIFDPYMSLDGFGFFNSHSISRKDVFRKRGKYKITFHYSSKSKDIKDYLGDGKEDDELKKMFEKVHHLELKSNILEIEIR